jgi:hypothetical protein
VGGSGANVPARKGASQGGGVFGRQARRPVTRIAYFTKKIDRAGKSLDWVVNIVSLIPAREGPIFNPGKDAASPSGGSIMTTHLSDIAGDRNPLAPCTGCESLDAIGKEMFQAPGLLELERTLERHPHYPLLKLKEQMARRPAYMLGLGGEAWESVYGFREVAWSAAPADGNGRGDSHLRPRGTKSRLWGGDDAGGYQTAAACQKRSWGGKARRGNKRHKEVTKKEAGEKLRAKVNAIIVRMTKAGRTEGEIEQELIEKVYSLYDYQHAEECGYSEKAAKTFYRTPEYTSWKRYRPRGNAARLDPTSAAVDFTSTGGRSSKTGTSRNAQFAAKNNLSVGRGGRLPELTAEAREKMAKVPGASEWYEQNRDKLEDLSDSEEFADNP